MSAAGRIGVNIPTDLVASNTPLDAFTLYPQYFDHVARYDGNTYYDDTADAYTSPGNSFVILS